MIQKMICHFVHFPVSAGLVFPCLIKIGLKYQVPVTRRQQCEYISSLEKHACTYYLTSFLGPQLLSPKAH